MMAEWSKAPDSSVTTWPASEGHSGPRLWAWVQIPLLTRRFLVALETKMPSVLSISLSSFETRMSICEARNKLEK